MPQIEITQLNKERLDELARQLLVLCADEDLDDEKLRAAAEGLLPNLCDELQNAGFGVQDDLGLEV